MGEPVHSIDVHDLIAYGDDLIELLKNKNDAESLTQAVQGAKSLQSSCIADYSYMYNLLEEAQSKIDTCDQEIGTAKDESEIEPIQQELDDMLQREKSLLKELRIVNNEIDALQQQMSSVDERKENLKQKARDELRLQKLLSMYASVTNLIPDLYDETRICGQIVDRHKKKVEKFEFDATEMTASEICNRLWKAMP